MTARPDSSGPTTVARPAPCGDARESVSIGTGPRTYSPRARAEHLSVRGQVPRPGPGRLGQRPRLDIHAWRAARRASHGAEDLRVRAPAVRPRHRPRRCRGSRRSGRHRMAARGPCPSVRAPGRSPITRSHGPVSWRHPERNHLRAGRRASPRRAPRAGVPGGRRVVARHEHPDQRRLRRCRHLRHPARPGYWAARDGRRQPPQRSPGGEPGSRGHHRLHRAGLHLDGKAPTTCVRPGRQQAPRRAARHRATRRRRHPVRRRVSGQGRIIGPDAGCSSRLRSRAGARVLGRSRRRPQPSTDTLRRLGEMVATGQVVPVIDRRFPLDQTAGAIEYMETTHTQGKVVVVP